MVFAKQINISGWKTDFIVFHTINSLTPNHFSSIDTDIMKIVFMLINTWEYNGMKLCIGVNM